MKNYFFLVLLLALPPTGAATAPPHLRYAIASAAGSASLGDGGPAIDAQLGIVQGVAADGAGNLYLSDTNHNIVRRIDPTGTITTVAGNGTAGFSGDGGGATAAQLNFPYGVAIDSDGYLYIADLNNNRIRRVSPSGIIQTYAGSGGNGSSGDGGPATFAQMLSPRNVLVDPSGNLYISEFAAHRIRKVAPNGTISTVAGTGIAGYRGDGGPATGAQLAFPAGLAMDRLGNLYIADTGNQRVREVLASGMMITALGGSANLWLLTPVAVAVDSAGDIFVADTTAEIHEYTTAGKFFVAAGSGSTGFAGDGGPATSALLTQPLDLAFDSLGDLYIADHDRVRKVSAKGVISTVAGANYLYAIGDGGPATAAELYLPFAVTLDISGNLYISDTGTNRVRQVSPAGVVSTFAGTGVEAPGGEGTVATATTLMTPTGMAVDPSGNLTFAETGANRIRQIAADGRIRTIAGTGAAGLGPDLLPPVQTQLNAPRGVCFDRAGSLYIVDTGNQRVLRAPANGVVTTVAGNGGAGSAGDGGPAPVAQLDQPSACALDSAGDLFIADTYNHSIRKVDATGTITTVAGAGVPGYSGDEGPATAAALNAPGGVTVDDNGNIFIADTGNNVIRQVTADGVIHTSAGTGTAAFGGDGGPALSASLDAPGGMVLDGSGDLFFADTANNRVRLLMPAVPIAPPATAPPTALTVVNAASLSTGPVAPGEVVTIYGAGMGPQSGVSALINPDSSLATNLGGTQVWFDGVAAPLFYAQSGQINAQVPYTVSGNAATNVEVDYQGVAVNTVSVPVVLAAPGVFATTVNQDGSLNAISNPAQASSYLTIYATGQGLSNGLNLAGQIAAAPYAPSELPVSATIDGIAAQIVWSGSAPGLVGMLQVNLVIPGPYLPSGPNVLQLSVGSAAAPIMTIWVQ